ncbi:MAG: hypothetical protein FWC68_04905, partial [Oscillospiraceae bacterium]|nr:hypothetical protein [Oscillospiraceae bacterium]
MNKIKVTDEGIVHVPVKDKVGKRALKKLNKLLRQNNISVVVLSEQLAKADILKDSLNENNVDMLEGRILFNHLIHNIVQYVAKKKDKKMETIEVSVMIDISNDLSVENIVLLAKNVKNLNIVTSNIQRFKRVETYLYEEVG